VDVDLLVVVALEGHLGMDCLLVVLVERSLWVAEIPLQQYVGHPQVELIRGVVLENWGLCSVVVLDLEVCKEDDGGVGGEEDEDVPRPVQVGETHARPPGAKDSIIHPAGDCHAPEYNASPAKGENSKILFSAKLQEQQGNCWHPKQHENEGIDDRL